MKPTYTTSLWEDIHDLAMLCIAGGLCITTMILALTGHPGWLSVIPALAGIGINWLVPKRDKNGEPIK